MFRRSIRQKILGLAAGLITRAGNASLPIAGLPQPNVVAPDLPALADRIITLWKS